MKNTNLLVSQNSSPRGEVLPLEKSGKSWSNTLHIIVGAVCCVAAVVFALTAALSIASAILAATTGGGAAGIIVGSVSAVIFTGLAIGSIALAANSFKKLK